MTCASTCAELPGFLDDNDECMPCLEGCAKCYDRYTCEMCHPGLFLTNGEMHDMCTETCPALNLFKAYHNP